MNLKSFLRQRIIKIFPNQTQNFIERIYLFYFVKNYVENEVKIIRQLCDKRKKSFDIGANQGIFTLFLCKFSAHVHCFEPVPRLGEYLNERFKGCNVTIQNCAIGNINSYVYLSIPCIGDKSIETRSSLVKEFKNEYIFGQRVTNTKRVKVPVKKLDDFKIKNIGFMKIDVEGYELEVLEGGKNTIKKNMPNLFIEIEQRHHGNKSIVEIFKYIMEFGYFGYFVRNKKIIDIEDFNEKEMQDIDNQDSKNYINNFIFSHNEIKNLSL